MTPIGMVMLMVEEMLQVDFVVIDARFAYNAIMGRGWIHEIEGGVPSILHQVMRCLSPDGTKATDIRGDQATVQRCYNIVT